MINNITDINILRLKTAWKNCERHWHHLQYAISALQPTFPLSADTINNLDDETIQDWDQFLLRFSKIQDAMGNSLFPSLLSFLKEPLENSPMIDKLNRLEQLGIIESVGDWDQLRAIRNGFAHDYPDNAEITAANLNHAVKSVKIIENILEQVATRFHTSLL